ncbi:Acetyl-coenzyme A synthetase, cytoplasmic [Platysternon megacephalum]|uniref:Acetyl-coenzyme A synthetase, cytoplasmic n=1 Tax=Platysternon megacephalum TaxID=55544 RepID=A0A4D9ECA8_9SAUR|nr:Acetyl-coenzyme A synthetase, cytoplasmic [Platysternon megacephalum]
MGVKTVIMTVMGVQRPHGSLFAFLSWLVICCCKPTYVAPIREKIGPIATPDYIQHAPGLPKTRSGKIMRRVLRKIAKNDRDLGDTSTVADPAVINHLFSNRCDTAL